MGASAVVLSDDPLEDSVEDVVDFVSFSLRFKAAKDRACCRFRASSSTGRKARSC
jgi:hypothetical protein